MKIKRRGFITTAIGLFGASYLPRVDVSAGMAPVTTEAQRGFWGVHSYGFTTKFPLKIDNEYHFIPASGVYTQNNSYEAVLEFNCVLYAEENERIVEYKLDFSCGEKEWVRTKKFKPKEERKYKLLSEQMGRDWTMGAHGYANTLENVQMCPYYTSSDLEFWKSGTKDTATISELTKSNDMFKDLYDIVVRFSSPDHPNFKKGTAKDHENVMRLNKCHLTNSTKKIYPPEVKREKG